MAITFDAALGNFPVTQEAAGAGSAVITTSAVAAAGSRIVVLVSWFDGGGAVFTVSDSDGSYTKDKQVDNGSDHTAVFSRVLVGSLASSSSITISWTSVFGSGGVGAAACSYLGTTAVDTTASNTTSGTGFSSGSATNAVADALFAGGAGIDGPATTSVGGTNTNGTMRFDFWTGGGVNQGMRMLDSIASSIGAQALTGTWNSSGTTTGALVVYSGTASAGPPIPQPLLMLMGIPMPGQQPPLPFGLIPDQVPQTAVPGIWLPPTTTPSPRNRSFFVVRGRQVKPVSLQEAPITEQRSPAVRREVVRQPRGQRSFPTQPQIPVPPTIAGNRSDSQRSKAALLQRGKRWNVVPSQAAVIVSSWIPQRLMPRRFFASIGKGKRSTPIAEHTTPRPFKRANVRAVVKAIRGRGQVALTDQAAPVRTAPKRSQAMTSRGRAFRHLPAQAHAPLRVFRSVRYRIGAARPGRQITPTPTQTAPTAPAWTPGRTATPRKLLSGAQRGRRVTVTPPQVSVPAPAIPRTVSKWRWAALRKGRQTNPVLTQAAAAPPAYPTPKLGAARRLLSGAQRGRQVGPIPAQQTPTTPTFVPQSARARVRAAMFQRGKVLRPPLSQAHAPMVPTRTRAKVALASRRRRGDIPHAQANPPRQGQKSRRLLARVRRGLSWAFPWFQAIQPPPPSVVEVFPVTGNSATTPTLTANQAVTNATTGSSVVTPMVSASEVVTPVPTTNQVVTPMITGNAL